MNAIQNLTDVSGMSYDDLFTFFNKYYRSYDSDNNTMLVDSVSNDTVPASNVPNGTSFGFKEAQTIYNTINNTFDEMNDLENNPENATTVQEDLKNVTKIIDANKENPDMFK